MAREGMRAGDSDRQAVADQLKTALDEGRLDLSEYDERLQKVYAAKTFGDFDGLLDDLPGTVPVAHSQVQPAPAPAGPAQSEPPQHSGASMFARLAGPFGGGFLTCVVIWLVTCIASGHLVYFWPVWLLIPLLLGMGGAWQQGQNHGRQRNRDRRRGRY